MARFFVPIVAQAQHKSGGGARLNDISLYDMIYGKPYYIFALQI